MSRATVRARYGRALAAAAAWAALGCGALAGCKSSDEEGTEATSVGGAAGSAGGAGGAAPARQLQGMLDADILGQATVTIGELGGGAATARVALVRGHGLLPDGTTLEGGGRIEAFPEASTTLYTAIFSAPAYPAGLCGEQPIGLALSLRRAGPNDRVAGGLSAYCGGDVRRGKPVRIVRLSGSLPRSP
jgi:hypothetical protein